MRHPRSLRRLRVSLPSDFLRGRGFAPIHRVDGIANETGNSFHADRAKKSHAITADSGKPTPAHSDGRGPLPGRLNLFQATMLDWRDLHPYNAVHAVRVERPLDREALAAAIADELSARGLVGLTLDRRRCRYAWRGGRGGAAVEAIEPGADWQASLASAFERHLNAAFARSGPIDPFRFFAMPVDGAFFLGLAYDHFIAGGDSIIVLLHAIVERYAGRPVETARMRLYPRTHARLFLRHPWHFARGLARLPSLAQSCRRTIRPRYRKIEDGQNAFTFFVLERDRYAALRHAAKQWGVTLNDALIALLLLAQDAVMPARDMTKRRHELAVASIINLRAAHGEATHTTFGQFLSSFRVSHAVPPGVALRDIAKDVHRATSRIKRGKMHLVTLFAMAVDRAIGRLQTPARRMSIYAKSYPVGAGVSSLNVDALWLPPDGGTAPIYIRGVPTGPLSPIVVAVTTSGDRLCAGLSYRTTAVTADMIAGVRRDFLTRIDALA